ncbi:MAG: hypothetical protein B7733_10785 [Myxococcales bacterium FL481]|nr:MAG: hypothetical protein B7733_10785 [Myxococcales bacterium FL481]
MGEVPTGDDENGHEPDAEPGCKNIDFLFVIDNSGSMGDEQQNLRTSVPEFITSINSILELDAINLMVNATDDYAINNQDPCTGLGASVMVSEGGECGPYAGGSHFMTEADDLNEAFECAANLGVAGDGTGNERPMDAVKEAIGGGLECNDGFVRDDALLVVTVITDEDDAPGDPDGHSNSSGDPEEWFEKVVDAKDGNVDHVVALALVGVEKPNECPPFQWNGQTGAEINTSIREWVDMFGDYGFVGDVCASSYGPFFEAALKVIEEACEEFPPQ